ncbi:uncharacterized protein LOC124664520 [Lolium rigidum]|uniref:uncharacterized protein LOC124664520 n=1 Tax=Lolium rigidum TaxID=89674 RepID=UPI001F5C77C7|nr:uncharacterized protein LOC124664520 [Lolium rigidum]
MAAAACVSGGSGIEVPRVCGDVDVSTVVDRLPARWDHPTGGGSSDRRCLLLKELQNQWTPDPVTSRLLQDLYEALNDGRALVESCQERRTWSLVFRTQKKANKFDALDQRISKILEMFHIANMILIVKTNRNGVGAVAASAYASSSSAADVKEMVSLAVSIVEEAKKQRQNREEIQQLVQFVEQVANLLQQLQSANLWWDAKTKLLLDGLKDLLQQARNILSHHKQPHRSNTRMPQAFFCPGGGYYSQDEPDQILQVAYGIWYYVQVLPIITMRHIHI